MQQCRAGIKLAIGTTIVVSSVVSIGYMAYRWTGEKSIGHIADSNVLYAVGAVAAAAPSFALRVTYGVGKGVYSCCANFCRWVSKGDEKKLLLPSAQAAADKIDSAVSEFDRARVRSLDEASELSDLSETSEAQDLERQEDEAISEVGSINSAQTQMSSRKQWLKVKAKTSHILASTSRVGVWGSTYIAIPNWIYGDLLLEQFKHESGFLPSLNSDLQDWVSLSIVFALSAMTDVLLEYREKRNREAWCEGEKATLEDIAFRAKINIISNALIFAIACGLQEAVPYSVIGFLATRVGNIVLTFLLPSLVSWCVTGQLELCNVREQRDRLRAHLGRMKEQHHAKSKNLMAKLGRVQESGVIASRVITEEDSREIITNAAKQVAKTAKKDVIGTSEVPEKEVFRLAKQEAEKVISQAVVKVSAEAAKKVIAKIADRELEQADRDAAANAVRKAIGEAVEKAKPSALKAAKAVFEEYQQMQKEEKAKAIIESKATNQKVHAQSAETSSGATKANASKAIQQSADSAQSKRAPGSKKRENEVAAMLGTVGLPAPAKVALGRSGLIMKVQPVNQGLAQTQMLAQTSLVI